MKTKATQLIIIILFVIFAHGCKYSGIAAKDVKPDKPEIYVLNANEFVKAEPKNDETMIVEVPTIKYQEGQLKPLPETEPAAGIKKQNKNIEVLSKPHPIPIPSKKDRSLLTKRDRELIASLAKTTVMQQTVKNATKQSRVVPSPLPENWINAITVYDYMEGALYQLYLTPNRITDIILEEGEKIISQSAGDSLRWLVGETESGSGDQRRSHLIIKPKHTNIDTNLTITTDRRTYYCELHSTKNKSYMAGVKWNYSETNFIQKYKLAKKEDEKKSQKILKISNLETMNFDYIFKSHDKRKYIEWYPIRAFDNGKKTFIQFPPDMTNRQSPALYVLSNETYRKPQIVNYRIKDGFYVVDRLFQAAILMEGTKKQRKVTILNKKLYKEYQQSEDPFTRKNH